HRADLVGGLLAAGCADRAVLGALAPEAGRLRALVMAELLLGAEPGSLVRARAGSEAPRPLRRYYARAYLPVASAQAPRDGLASRLKPRLNAALRAAGAGSTEDGPSRHGSLDGRSFDCVPLELIGDWRAGVEVVREGVRAAGAPGHSTVEVRRRGEVVTVGLDQPLPGDWRRRAGGSGPDHRVGGGRAPTAAAARRGPRLLPAARREGPPPSGEQAGGPGPVSAHSARLGRGRPASPPAPRASAEGAGSPQWPQTAAPARGRWARENAPPPPRPQRRDHRPGVLSR